MMGVGEAEDAVRVHGRGEITRTMITTSSEGDEIFLVVTKTSGGSQRYLVVDGRNPVEVPGFFKERVHKMLQLGAPIGQILDELAKREVWPPQRAQAARRTKEFSMPAVNIKRGGRLMVQV